MADAPTFQDFLEIGVQAVADAPGTRLTEDAARLDGSTLNILLSAAALMAERVAQDVSDVEAGTLIDTAEGPALDRLAYDMPYGVERMAASPAVLTVQFVRPNAALGEGTIPAGTRFKLGGVSFRTETVIAVPTTATSVNGPAQAEVTGPAGNVALGTVGSPITPLFDAFTPHAVENGTGGNDAETDPSLRARLRAAPRAARRGTLAAIEFGALTVPGVVFASALEILNADGSQAHLVELIVADNAGQSNTVLAGRVALVMDDWRAGGIPVQVLRGERVLTTIRVTLTYGAGVDTGVAKAAAVQRIVAAVNAGAPAATLYPDLIASAARGSSATDSGVLSCTVTEPAGPLVPSNTQVIRASVASVVVT